MYPRHSSSCCSFFHTKLPHFHYTITEIHQSIRAKRKTELRMFQKNYRFNCISGSESSNQPGASATYYQTVHYRQFPANTNISTLHPKDHQHETPVQAREPKTSSLSSRRLQFSQFWMSFLHHPFDHSSGPSSCNCFLCCA